MTDKDITICGHGSGKPSTKNLNTYSSTRYSQTFKHDGDVIHKGIIRVRRLKALTDAGRKMFHDTYKTIIGRNEYSQTYRDYVYSPRSNGKYYSDCSSSGCATYRRVGYNVTNLNTVGILTSSLFEDVPVNIVKGHIMNPEVLKVGDAIMFAGNSSRPTYGYVGHVEYVYEMPSAPTINKETFTMNMSVLCKSCTGSEVGGLQALLKGRGYKDQNGSALIVDNDFGSKTEYAVNRAKKAYGLPQDGVANEALWKKLLGA